MDLNKESIGKRIELIRRNLGDNMREFGERIANHLNIDLDDAPSDSIVSRWEKGKSIPSPERLKAIAELGRISVEELLYGKQSWVQIETGVFIEIKEPISFDEMLKFEDRTQYTYKCLIILSTTDWLANKNYAEIEFYAYGTINIYITESKENFDYYRVDGIEELYKRPYEGLFGTNTYNSVSEYLVKKALEKDELKSMKLSFDDLEPLS